jgi:hypothetical protein
MRGLDEAARVVVDLHEARGEGGSTRARKGDARFAGAMQVWEALTGLTGDAALGRAYDRVQVAATRADIEAMEDAALAADPAPCPFPHCDYDPAVDGQHRHPDTAPCVIEGSHLRSTRHGRAECPVGQPNAAWGAVT